MELSRPEYWSGLPFLSPGDLPNSGTKPRSPTLQVDSSPAEPQESPKQLYIGRKCHLKTLIELPYSSDGKESAFNAGDPGSVPGLEYPLVKGIALFFTGEPHGQRSLVCYSPWGHKGSDMTKRLISLLLSPKWAPAKM